MAWTNLGAGTARFWTLRAHLRAFVRPVVLCGGAGLIGNACEPPYSITTNPPLIPAWDSTVTDYVTRCADKPVQVSVAGSADVQVLVDEHGVAPGNSTQVPLTSGQAFPIDVTLADGTRSRYSVRCLPSDFPQFMTQRFGTPQAEYYIAAPWGAANTGQAAPPGVSNQYVAIFNNHGAPVWWQKSAGSSGPLDAKLLPNGNIAWMHFSSFTDGTGGGVEQHRLDGTLVPAPTTVGSPPDFHELQLLPNGNYAMARYFPLPGVSLAACGGPESAIVTDNELQEVAPDGSLVWSWKASAHIPVAETRWVSNCAPDLAQHDIYHFNSLEPAGDAFIVSFRHLDAVYKISRSTGAILWKLGGSARPESLTVMGDPISDAGGSLFGGQHDARLLADGTLTVHDNRSLQADAVPRAVRFRIDEVAKTAALVESVSDPNVRTSSCCGSARKLPTGNWVTEWGANPIITELSPDATVVFRLSVMDLLFSYRADPLTPGRLSRLALVQGMNAQYPRTPSP